jgi:hypothetical protein
MRVQPVGELVFERDGNEHKIPASQLSGGKPQKEADGLHGESEDWSQIFTVSSVFGDFAWHVSYTFGSEGFDLSDSERIKTPSGIEVIEDISFKAN